MPDEVTLTPEEQQQRGRSSRRADRGSTWASDALATSRELAPLQHERTRRTEGAREWPGHRGMLAVGRALVGGYFAYSGINHFANHGALTEYAKSKNVPAPDLAVAASGALILLGGLSALTGVQPKVGAAFIAAFLLGVSPKMHAFWRVEDQQQRMNELMNFMRNVALLGTAALLAAFPEPWPDSLGRRNHAAV